MLKIFYTNKKISSFNFLKNIFLQYFNLKLTEKDIIKSKTGKPFLKNSNLFFNISHTDNFLIIAVSDCETGIDVECLNRKVSFAVAEKYFKDEYNNVNELIKLWTIKESLLKFFGKSVLTDLKDIKITNNDIFYKNEKTALKPFCLKIDDFYITIFTKNNYMLSSTDVNKL